MKFTRNSSSLPHVHLKAWALVAILCFLASPLFAQVPVVTSSLNASGKLGAAFTYRIKATNKPTQFYATGLPKGLKLNATTGLISGTPTKSGTFKIIISARNAKGISKTGILEVKVTKKETAKSNMVTVNGGTLPQGSGLAGQKVKTFQQPTGGARLEWK
ncbi:MAG: Ig domain-containing protein [Spartobacteria bacterium]